MPARYELEKLFSVRSEVRGERVRSKHEKVGECSLHVANHHRSLNVGVVSLCDVMEQTTLKNCLPAVFLAKAGKSGSTRHQE